MKKNEIYNQYYQSMGDRFTQLRIVKFYDLDNENGICIIKNPSTKYPYQYMDLKSGYVFGITFTSLKYAREFRLDNTFYIWIKKLTEVRHTARYQQLVDRYDEMIKSYERIHKQ